MTDPAPPRAGTEPEGNRAELPRAGTESAPPRVGTEAEGSRAVPIPIGIDLGTTNSLVAVATHGVSRLLQHSDGAALLPSVVYYAADGRVLVGREARRLGEREPRRVLRSVKRFLGRAATDPDVVRLLGARQAPPRNDEEARSVRFALPERAVGPVEASCEILRELVATARADLGSVGPAVITVPAHFDHAQREATVQAARLAGLTVLRLLNEPTAAALAYGLERAQVGLFVIFDLGGGTFDITVLRLEDGLFQVVSTGGDTMLGGDDLDHLLVERMLEALEEHTDDLCDGAIARLSSAARELKHQLTEASTATVVLSGVTSRDVEFSLERTELERLSVPLFERMGRVVRRALRDAGVEPGSLDGVVLVGGMTRMPALRAYVTELFGRAPLCDLDPDTIVARGAALHAAELAGGDMLADAAGGGDGPNVAVPGAADPQGGMGGARRRGQTRLLDVVPLSIGLEILGGTVERLIPRNSPVPVAVSSTFTTHVDGQTGFELHVVQGEREFVADCQTLCRMHLAVPPMPAGLARLEVTYRIDESGLLSVTAREMHSGRVGAVQVVPGRGLGSDAVEAQVEAAALHRDRDTEARQLVELRIHAESILAATDRALVTDADLLGPEERAEIVTSLERLRRAIPKAERSLLLELLLEDVHAATADFTERRMNRAVVEIVTGQSLRG